MAAGVEAQVNDHRVALQQLVDNERAYEERILDIANGAAQSLLTETVNGHVHGVTTNVGKFTLAMHGYDGCYGRSDIKPNVEEFYRVLDATFEDAYDEPVATFGRGPVGNEIELRSLGFAPMRGRLGAEETPLQFEMTHNRERDSYVGSVAINLRQMHRWMSSESITVVPSIQESNCLVIAKFERAKGHLADDIELYENYAIGWEQIYAARKLGSQHGMSGDARFLAGITQARANFYDTRKQEQTPIR